MLNKAPRERGQEDACVAWLAQQGCIFGVALHVHGSVAAAGDDLPLLRTRMVERKFSELSRQASTPQGVRYACVGDRHEVIL